MKLVANFLPGEIVIEEGSVSSLVIENQGLFFKIVNCLYEQCKGEEGAIILSDNKGILKISKNVELITTLVPFEINEKRLLSKISDQIEKEALNETFFQTTMGLLAQIENYLGNLVDFLPCSIDFSEISISSMIKACGMMIKDDSESMLEKVLNYISLVRDILGERLFIFVNLKSFFSDKEMHQFLNMAIDRKACILLIDNMEKILLDGEKRLIIDQDLCII